MHIEYSEVLNGIHVILKGRLTALDIVKAFDEMLNHPQFSKHMNSLWDITDATHPDLTVDDLKVIGTHVTRMADIRGNGKTAWVVANDIDFGIARMFEMLTDSDVPIDFRVFRDMVEAKLWLGTDISKIKHVEANDSRLNNK